MLKFVPIVLMLVAGTSATDSCSEPPSSVCPNDNIPRNFPKSGEEFENFCKFGIEFFECTAEYEQKCREDMRVKLSSVYLRILQDVCDEDTLLYSAIVENIKCFSELLEEGGQRKCSEERDLSLANRYTDALEEEGLLNLDNAADQNERLIIYMCIGVLQELACIAKKTEEKCGTVAMDAYVETAKKFGPLFECGDKFDLLPRIIHMSKSEHKKDVMVMENRDDIQHYHHHPHHHHKKIHHHQYGPKQSHDHIHNHNRKHNNGHEYRDKQNGNLNHRDDHKHAHGHKYQQDQGHSPKHLHGHSHKHNHKHQHHKHGFSHIYNHVHNHNHKHGHGHKHQRKHGHNHHQNHNHKYNHKYAPILPHRQKHRNTYARIFPHGQKHRYPIAHILPYRQKHRNPIAHIHPRRQKHRNPIAHIHPRRQKHRNPIAHIHPRRQKHRNTYAHILPHRQKHRNTENKGLIHLFFYNKRHKNYEFHISDDSSVQNHTLQNAKVYQKHSYNDYIFPVKQNQEQQYSHLQHSNSNNKPPDYVPRTDVITGSDKIFPYNENHKDHQEFNFKVFYDELRKNYTYLPEQTIDTSRDVKDILHRVSTLIAVKYLMNQDRNQKMSRKMLSE